MIGGADITQDDLIIYKLLGQDIIKYKSLFPHVSAAIQLSNNGNKLPSKGDTIKYIYKNSQHKDPLCRVQSIDSTNGVGRKLDYDKEKYKEMILDAAETVLGYFGFDTKKVEMAPRIETTERMISEQRLFKDTILHLFCL